MPPATEPEVQRAETKAMANARNAGLQSLELVLRSLTTALNPNAECRTQSFHWGYGATVARLTPDQKVGSLNLSALICRSIDTPAQGTTHARRAGTGCIAPLPRCGGPAPGACRVHRPDDDIEGWPLGVAEHRRHVGCDAPAPPDRQPTRPTNPRAHSNNNE